MCKILNEILHLIAAQDVNILLKLPHRVGAFMNECDVVNHQHSLRQLNTATFTHSFIHTNIHIREHTHTRTHHHHADNANFTPEVIYLIRC